MSENRTARDELSAVELEQELECRAGGPGAASYSRFLGAEVMLFIVVERARRNIVVDVPRHHQAMCGLACSLRVVAWHWQASATAATFLVSFSSAAVFEAPKLVNYHLALREIPL